MSNAGKNYFHQLDALRGIACLMVLFHHLVPGSSKWIALGPLGVRLFFVMTGFLLIGNLLQQVEKKSTPLDIFKTFYKKRIIRIFPVYFLALGVLCLLGVEPARQIWIWISTFSINFYMGLHEQWAGVLSHFWFLATSEQMVLALVLIALLIPRRFLPKLFLFCFVGAWLHRWIGTEIGVAPMMIWYSPLSSMDSMAMGAIIGIIYRERKEQVQYLASSCGIPLLAWGFLLIAAGIRIWLYSTPWIHLAETFEALFFGWLILRTAVGFTHLWEKILTFPGLVYTGMISYALYVFHPIMHHYVQFNYERTGIPSDASNFGVIGATFFMTYLISSLSWYLMEKPLIAMKFKSNPSTESK
jgi:peptidoglycan/LPS O-acetylase OafA/YrhL